MSDTIPSSTPAVSARTPEVPAGWYADPLTPGHARWWSGYDWTHHTQLVPVETPHQSDWEPINLLVPRASSMATRSLVWGIISFLIPVTALANILAIIYGAAALHYARRLASDGYAANYRGRAIAGIVLACLGLLILGGLVVASVVAMSPR